ncbi:unnamed protein product [Linum tenue]|uniref:Uncharacterized protein n=1 Tax=Linum tenue TaxID=586396 RepID=A0AAV0QC72_9ROSI|nr:unnamed protein product [Linum tenue]
MAGKLRHEEIGENIIDDEPETALDKYFRAKVGIDDLVAQEEELLSRVAPSRDTHRRMKTCLEADTAAHSDGLLAMLARGNCVYPDSLGGRRERAIDALRVKLAIMKAEGLLKEPGEFEELMDRPGELNDSIQELIDSLRNASDSISTGLAALYLGKSTAIRQKKEQMEELFIRFDMETLQVQMNEFDKLRELGDFVGCRAKFDRRFKPRLAYVISHLEELQQLVVSSMDALTPHDDD